MDQQGRSVARRVAQVIGRKIRVRGREGTVIRWEPIGAGSCDALIQFMPPGTEERKRDEPCWYSSTELVPIDGLGPLPSRKEAREARRVEMLAQLHKIRAQHVADFAKPWPGAEHGKVIVGRALDGAIGDLEKKGGR